MPVIDVAAGIKLAAIAWEISETNKARKRQERFQKALAKEKNWQDMLKIKLKSFNENVLRQKNNIAKLETQGQVDLANKARNELENFTEDFRRKNTGIAQTMGMGKQREFNLDQREQARLLELNNAVGTIPDIATSMRGGLPSGGGGGQGAFGQFYNASQAAAGKFKQDFDPMIKAQNALARAQEDIPFENQQMKTQFGLGADYFGAQGEAFAGDLGKAEQKFGADVAGKQQGLAEASIEGTSKFNLPEAYMKEPPGSKATGMASAVGNIVDLFKNGKSSTKSVWKNPNTGTNEYYG